MQWYMLQMIPQGYEGCFIRRIGVLSHWEYMLTCHHNDGIQGTSDSFMLCNYPFLILQVHVHNNGILHVNHIHQSDISLMFVY